MKEVDVLIKGTTALTVDDHTPVLRGTDIAIKNGFITDIGQGLKYDAKTEIDGRKKFVLPGLVDAHTHCFQIFLRGALSLKELNVHPIWLKILIPFEAEMTVEEAKISAELACLNMLKKGITSFADAGGPYPNILAETAYRAGLRGRITHSTMDKGPENYVRKVEDNRRLREKWRSGRIQAWFSIRQIMTSSDDLIYESFEAARRDDAGIHIHLNEEISEIDHALQRWGMRPVEFLMKRGMLGKNVVAAHCAFLTDDEVRMLVGSGTNVVHCPMINLVYMTFPKVPLLLELGCNVALGSDGGSYRGLDLFVDMNIALAGHTAYFGTPYYDSAVIQPTQLLRMATVNGAKTIQENSLGMVKKGYKADLITINRWQPHITPLHDPTTLPLFATGSDVVDVLIDGHPVMLNRNLLTVDEEKILQEAQEISDTVLERIFQLVKKQ